MNNQQARVTKNIISSLNYLMVEAENSHIPQIARLLKLCIRDVYLSFDGPDDEMAKKNSITSEVDLFMAIRFLSRFASIKDEVLKKEIYAEIEKLSHQSSPGGL